VAAILAVGSPTKSPPRTLFNILQTQGLRPFRISLCPSALSGLGEFFLIGVCEAHRGSAGNVPSPALVAVHCTFGTDRGLYNRPKY
jgi:hypothetical protein